MSTLRLERIGDLEAARPEWSALAEASGNPFCTWEWMHTWWRHFGRGSELHALRAVREDGSTAAILPLYVALRGRRRHAHLLGDGLSGRNGLVAAPGDAIAAARLLRVAVGDHCHADLLSTSLRADERWDERLGGAEIWRVASPVVTIGGRSWDELLAAGSKNFRAQVRKFERRLERDHALGFRDADDDSRLDADIDLHFRLHEQRFADGSSDALTGGRDAFHREWMRLAFERGWLVLRFLELGGEPVASWYAFRFGGIEWSFQNGRDPASERESVGFVLLCHMIRESCGAGMAEFNLLTGDQGYKQRFTDTDPALARIVMAANPYGHAVVAGQRAKPHARVVRDRVRQARQLRTIGDLPTA